MFKNRYKDAPRWLEADPPMLAVPVRIEADGDGSKTIRPLGRWGELKAVEPSAEVLAEVWDGADRATGLGIVARGIVVVDPDSPEAEAFIRGLDLPPAPSFRSRRGVKRIYAAPEGLEVPEKLLLRDNLEVLGPGSLVVVPPTAVVGPDGEVVARYEWIRGAHLFDDFRGHVPPCPPRLAEEIRRAAEWKAAGLPGAPRDVEGWTRDLLDRVEAFVRRFVAFPSDREAAVIALFVLATHVAEAFDLAPMLNVRSAERRCGKTVLLDAIALLAYEPLRAVSITPAALYRALDAALGEPPHRPRTLLLDEIDNAFYGREERGELLALLNAGYRREEAAYRIEKTAGGRFELRPFHVFGPKVLAGIGQLPGTLADRCFPVELRRRRPDEPVAPLRERRARAGADPLRREIEAWAKAARDALREADPELPPVTNFRLADIFEPLAAVADLAGEPWASRAREALEAAAGAERATESHGVTTIRALRELFDQRGADWLPSAEIVGALVERDDGPWAAWWADEVARAERDGRVPLRAVRALARLLEPFGIAPGSRRVGGRVVRGYSRASFADAWARYLPEDGSDQAEGEDTGDIAVVADARDEERPPTWPLTCDVADVAVVADVRNKQRPREAVGPPLLTPRRTATTATRTRFHR